MIKLASLFLLLAVGAHCYYIDDDSKELQKNKIVGGKPIPIEQAPYLAQITQYGSQICGGAIISEEWILTAAHCVESTYGLVIRTGSSFRENGEKHMVQKIIKHKNYNPITFENDIAMIKLAKNMKFSAKQKAIALSEKIAETDDEVKISGFGRTGNGEPPSASLQSAKVHVISREVCRQRYTEEDEPVTDDMFCAGTSETDTCSGDSGGPAVINEELAGVVSTGRECADAFFPGVYTQVYGYRQWIASNMQNY